MQGRLRAAIFEALISPHAHTSGQALGDFGIWEYPNRKQAGSTTRATWLADTMWRVLSVTAGTRSCGTASTGCATWARCPDKHLHRAGLRTSMIAEGASPG